MFDLVDSRLFWVDFEKVREHESPVTSIDYHSRLGLIVTSDQQGSIRFWNKEKKFLREIQFPNAVDSICFLN